jgi:hypothetical protein
MEPETARLFSMTLSAERTKNDQPEVTLQNVVSLLVGNVSVEQIALDHARALFPESEGWRDHRVVLAEIQQNMMFGPYRLTWDVEEVKDTTQE